MGALLVALAVVGLFTSFARAEAGGGDHVLVAAHDLAPGTRIGPDDVRLETIRLSTGLRAHVFLSRNAAVGHVVIARLAAGELVQRGALTDRSSDPTYRELTILVDGAQLQAVDEGDSVDVLVTTGTGSATRTDVAAGGARVLQIGRRTTGLGADGKVGVTFALSTFDDVSRVVQASHAGALTLVRSTGFTPQTSTYDTRSPEAEG